ncbi:hypothetical protein DCAR_0415856 [Daucus carota subsp. sativus]|uniref:Uncharacterized protein n=1 Tax=Daucus carota subsp. sativus TaxID=79200 RepID=A0A162A9W1_DAUCS|nr:PREDICTED: uncharacterized protein LOC108217259 [Daucus carota subsp. sativus]WOG96520.1 hypothetical protein DCAR_0415856 [Daucus carota subsp. sativus]
MKAGSKPLSSPSRSEKFPPPLMSFLRSNVGSKSRGKSRSGPLFFRKRNIAAASETQEPSSPKVTCIGQVRVRRSVRANSSKSRAKVKCPTLWFPKNLFCNSRKNNFGSVRPVLRKWVLFLRFGYCRKVDVEEDSPVSNRRSEYIKDTETEETEEAKQSFVSSTPPKNAFLLTRCRSAPYRSSSLASRFLGSPLSSPETEENLENLDYEEHEECSEEVKSSIHGRNSEASTQSLKDEAALLEPLILTRCKSEPARTGERLMNQ